MSGESEFVEWLTSQQKTSDLVQRAAGDDLAILNWPGKDLLLAGADQVLDGVHFESQVHDPKSIGRKAMNRNLSDCAAMACLPAAAVVSVALPKGAGVEYARELYRGLKEAGDALDCPIVGGDTAAWPGKLAVNVAILGRSAGIAPITRAGAKDGDAIFVTGPLGGSSRGRHMTFSPRVHLARKLAAAGKISAMIDLSDGLSRDLDQICRASGVGAMLDAASIPIHEDATAMRRDGRSPLEHALHDGEDYELLFTASQCDHPAAIVIGRIINGQGMLLVEGKETRALRPQGWQHSF